MSRSGFIPFGLKYGEELPSRVLAELESHMAAMQRLEKRTVAVNVYQASPTNPTATTSTAGVMMGLNGLIIPATSGVVLFMASGNVTNDTATRGATVRLRYGLGVAPVNGAALTGTIVVRALSFTLALAAQVVPFATQGVISGLVVGTPYWIDLSLAAVTAGTASLTMISLTALELRT